MLNSVSVPSAGIYLVTGYCQITVTSTYDRYDLYINPSGNVGQGTIMGDTADKSSSYPCMSVTGIVNKTAAGKIALELYCTDQGTFNVHYSLIQVYKIG